jgi:archaellum biogenesis ATPase FlaH
MERKQWCGLTIFMDQINHGVPGLWITSLRPKQVTKYSLRRTPVVYLTNEQIKGEVTLPLRRLDKVRDLVSSYLLRVRGKSVVLIDSFEELIAGDEFERKIEFLKEMVELCSKNNSNLIVQVDSNKLKNEQLAAIEKVIPPL